MCAIISVNDPLNGWSTSAIVANAGPATSGTGMKSSVNTSADDSRPRLMISTKRKPAAETISTTAAQGVQFKPGTPNTKLSVKSRLGEPAVPESQSRLMISTKRKLADDSTPVTITVAGAASAVAKVPAKSSVKSRLGEPVTSGQPQRRLMISTKRRQVDEAIPAAFEDGVQSKTARLNNSKSSIRSCLGERVTSESRSTLMISTKRKPAAAAAADDDDDEAQLGYVLSANHNTVFSRLGPSRI